MKYVDSDAILREEENDNAMNISLNDFSFVSTVNNIESINRKSSQINNDFKDIVNTNFEIPKIKKKKNLREIIFTGKNNVNYISILSTKQFAVGINDTIKTYLFNLFIFSEFINPKIIEKDERVNLYFIEKNKHLLSFHYNSKEVLKNLNLSSDKESLIIDFMKEINYFFQQNDYIEMELQNEKFKNKVVCLMYITIIFSFFLSFLLIFLISKAENNIIIILLIILLMILFIITIIFLIFSIYKYINLDLYILYNQINFMIKKYNQINNIIDKWNKSKFESLRLNVSVPISLNYIQFNLDPFQRIEIKHIEMKKIKEKFYPNNKISEMKLLEFQNIKELFNYDNDN